MTAPALALAAANLLLIGVLPRVFFRPGELNAAWWLTAAPFILAGAGVCTVAAGLEQPLEPPAGVSGLAGAAALVLSSASIMLICYAAGTHPHPVSLWHQPRDTPVRLVTFGAYAHVRHPFYAAFLLALAACLLAAPSPVTVTGSTKRPPTHSSRLCRATRCFRIQRRFMASPDRSQRQRAPPRNAH